MRNNLLVLFLLMITQAVSAQKLTVESMQATNDLTASQQRRQDLNGEPCGLVKVSLATTGATFEGNVIQPVEYKTGEYWVYMTKGSRELRIKHPSFVPLHVKFADYGIKDILSLTTYNLTLLMPQIGQTVDDGMRYLAMTVEPANATVYVDNNLQPLQKGTLSMLLSMGQHQYRAEAPGYEPKNGTFTIGDETLQLPVKLESAMASLSVSTTTQGTEIYVNDQLRGTSSWSGSLRPGTYRVEGRLKGYRNHRQNITLAQRERQQLTIPALQAITGVLNVNYQPLNAEVWIDGKKVGTSPNVFRNIPVGTHEVEIRANGYDSKNSSVIIKEGKTELFSGTLNKQTTIAQNSTPASQTESSVQMPIIEEGVPMAKAGNPQLPDWLNSSQPNHWIGVSPRTTDRKKARSAAIINAVLGYLRTNKEGKCKVNHLNEINTFNPNSISAYTNSMVTYNGFSCEVVDEYYNSRGEYFVRCGFGDNKQSMNQLEVFQTNDYTETDSQEKVHCKAGVLLLLNNQDYYSCDIDYDSSRDSGSSYQIKINNEPLIPATNMVYDKCLWKEQGDGSSLHIQLDKNGPSLGVATLAIYSFLPFVPKSIKCTGKVTGNYDETFGQFMFTADTLCYPVPIHFLSLNGRDLSMQIGNVNFQEKELVTFVDNVNSIIEENHDEKIGKRWLESQFPFNSDYNGRAITRISKTYCTLYDAFANLSMKLHAKTSHNEESSSDDIQTTDPLTFQDQSNTGMEFNDIGIRWYFENMPTEKQYGKMLGQYSITKKHPRRQGFYIAAEYNKDK